jgi:hypothetical protein
MPRTHCSNALVFPDLITLYGCQDDLSQSIRRAYFFLDFTAQRSSAFLQVRNNLRRCADLVAMFKRRSSAGMNQGWPRSRASFRLPGYYGLLIDSRPVIVGTGLRCLSISASAHIVISLA